MRSFKFVPLSKYNYNNQVKEDEIGRACNTNRGEDDNNPKTTIARVSMHW
jgi:hypothetical protein